MNRWRLARGIAVSAVKVTWRRLTHWAPLQPGWSWLYEVILHWMRARFRSHAPLEVTRRWMNSTGELEARRGRVDFEAVDAGGVPGEWVVPPEADDRVVLYMHGGGYAFGSPRSHRGITSAIARAGRCRVLSLDYRLAPEHPCPAGVDDVLTAFRWLQDQGVAADRIHFAGDSAGGGLSLGALQRLRDGKEAQPAGAVLLSPWLDLTLSGPRARDHEDIDYLGTADDIYAFGAHYAGELPRDDPRVSTLFGDFTGLAPMLILAGGAEVLVDDSTRAADKAAAAGVDVTLHVEPGEVHVYPMFAELTDRAADGVARIGAFVSR